MATRMTFADPSGSLGGRAVVQIDLQTLTGGTKRLEGVYLVESCDVFIDRHEIDITRRDSPWRETIAGLARTRLKLDLISDPARDNEKLPLSKMLAYAVLFGDPDAVWPLIDSILEERDRPEATG